MTRQTSLLYSLGYILLSLCVQAGCLLLFKLSQFGQAPFAQLPTAVILFFGALFVAPLLALGTRLGTTTRMITAALATLLALVFSQLLEGTVPGGGGYIWAPLTGMVVAYSLPHLFKERAPMLAAMLVYIVCTLLANYTFDSFLPLPFYGLVNVGTLFFGITFTQRDRVHHYGRRYAYVMIAVAAVANVLTALSLETPLRYVAVGFLAIVLSELADTEIYQRLLKRRWLTRVAASNAVSIPIDTFVFTLLAFYGAEWATTAWMTEVIVTDISVKLVVGFLAAVQILGTREQTSITRA